MGYDAYAHIIYGVVCDKSEVSTETYEPSCHHTYDENFRHCPHCGKPKKVYREMNFKNHKGIEWFSPDYESTTGIVGVELGATSSRKDIQPVFQPSEETIARVKNFLDEFDIAGDPGLQLMLRHSY